MSSVKSFSFEPERNEKDGKKDATEDISQDLHLNEDVRRREWGIIYGVFAATARVCQPSRRVSAVKSSAFCQQLFMVSISIKLI